MHAFDQWCQNDAELAGKSPDDAAEALRNTWWHPLVGTPDMLIEQLRAYADTGVEEIMLAWGTDLDAIEELQVFSERALPEL